MAPDAPGARDRAPLEQGPGPGSVAESHALQGRNRRRRCGGAQPVWEAGAGPRSGGERVARRTRARAECQRVSRCSKGLRLARPRRTRVPDRAGTRGRGLARRAARARSRRRGAAPCTQAAQDGGRKREEHPRCAAAALRGVDTAATHPRARRAQRRRRCTRGARQCKWRRARVGRLERRAFRSARSRRRACAAAGGLDTEAFPVCARYREAPPHRCIGARRHAARRDTADGPLRAAELRPHVQRAGVAAPGTRLLAQCAGGAHTHADRLRAFLSLAERPRLRRAQARRGSLRLFPRTRRRGSDAASVDERLSHAREWRTSRPGAFRSS